MMETKINKRKIIINAIKKTINLKSLVFLILLLSVNTLAWFIYVKTVSTTISISVKSWNITFSSDEHMVEKDMLINVDDVYPGMKDFKHELVTYNKSEVAASIKYTIYKVRLVDQEIYTVEGAELNSMSTSGLLTSNQLVEKLKTDYPFSIDIGLKDVDMSSDGSATFYVYVNWPFESGNDELDTEWGMKSYSFKEENPSLAPIQIDMRLTIEQIEE